MTLSLDVRTSALEPVAVGDLYIDRHRLRRLRKERGGARGALDEDLRLAARLRLEVGLRLGRALDHGRARVNQLDKVELVALFVSADLDLEPQLALVLGAEIHGIEIIALRQGGEKI